MKYLSLCSGIEAATVAWDPLGFEAVAFAEIDPFASAVLRHHYPTVPNWGDITTFKDWPDATVDVLVGGTPCQSFSVAGLRAGLDDPRGNLALTYLAILDRYRPRWCLWENVPGVLSINDGRDFGAFIGGLGELRYGYAWRVLDARYFALAQRRKRVFVVGSAGGWQRATAVLFDSRCLSGDFAPSREAGPDPAGGVAPGTDERRHDLAYSLETTCHDYSRADHFNVINEATIFDSTQLTHPANYSNPQPGDPCHPLAADAHVPKLATTTAVRRLTPRECERLQGFPDDWTRVPYRGQPAKDAPRYKALGNAMAVNVMAWIGRRLDYVNKVVPQ